MAVYTVHEPPNPPSDRMERAEALVFVRDGFSWGAALVPPVWLILRGEWLLLGAYVVALFVLGGGLAALGAQADWISLAVLAFHVLFGFEVHELRRWLLRKRGWREIATISGRTREDCERRFYDAWFAAEPLPPHRAPGRPEVRSLAGGAMIARLRDWSAQVRSMIGSKA